jgi:hypothetical protein
MYIILTRLAMIDGALTLESAVITVVGAFVDCGQFEEWMRVRADVNLSWEGRRRLVEIENRVSVTDRMRNGRTTARLALRTHLAYGTRGDILERAVRTMPCVDTTQRQHKRERERERERERVREGEQR